MLTLAGEQNAYEALVVRYQNAVITSAAQITHSRFMAEDAAQDAFVTAWMKLDTLKQPDKYGAWVCKIAKNCAINMVTRYRSYIDFDLVENQNIADDTRQNPAELYTLSEEKDELHKSIGKLPEKVGTIIRLHYFEGLSIAEIADKMRISVGTVKSQLHDGRRKIRKELCAMNEKYTDTLVQRVMKKVEELKLWQIKSDKGGFEEVYKDVLKEVEDLPECTDKYRALADVLMRGWWWLPGDKSDALFARIKEAAIAGKNDEVMEFIVTREDSQVYGGAKIDFIREKQIPMLEKAGFVRALGREWFWLGYHYFRQNRPEEGKAAYENVLKVLNPSHAYHALVGGALKMEEKLAGELKEKQKPSYSISSLAYELRYINGELHYWNDSGCSEGYMWSVANFISAILINSSRCDGRFFDTSLKVGESLVGTDGSTLTFTSDNESVTTPCGTFEDCQLWVIKHPNTRLGAVTTKNYYKSGVGIVRHENSAGGISDSRVLSAYGVTGDGLLPLAVHNKWQYADEYNPEAMRSELSLEVTYADEKSVIIASNQCIERIKYDENNWLDMVEQIANDYVEYVGSGVKIHDVSYAAERAEALAKTPMQKAHTKAAVSTVRRIMQTEKEFNPNYTATGHWNFFQKFFVQKKDGTLSIENDSRWSFEYKCMEGAAEADTPLLYNNVYGILQDVTNSIWSDEWKVGATPLVEYLLWSNTPVKTQIVCEDGGTVTTKAGTFENCLRLSLDISGFKDGTAYIGGKKEYVFAPGIGIVRTVSEYCGGAKKAVYELTAYEGTGVGYMPMADGMTRRYDALDLTDGFVGAVEYTYVMDDEGQTFIFSEQIGIRELPPPITFYSAILGEQIEERLWNQKKRDEARLRHDINNFHLLSHFLGRPARYWAAPKKAAAWNKYRMKIMEGLGENGEVPRAWWGHYASTCFRAACALFGSGNREEGYEYLERVFELFERWEAIPNGEELEVGDPLIYGDIKIIKGKSVIKLPNGALEPQMYDWLFEDRCSLVYYGLTATGGWEWFNPVRNEDKYKDCVERARRLMEAQK